MTTAASTALLGDPYIRSPQKSPMSKLSNDSAVGVSWRKQTKAQSSVSLSSAYARRNSLESLSGSLRNASVGRSLRWKLQSNHPLIEKLSGVAHFHYDLVELGPIKAELLHISEESNTNSDRRSCCGVGILKENEPLTKRNNCEHENGATATFLKLAKIYTLRVRSNQQTWTIRRSYENFVEFDKQLHRCVYDRRYSLLTELPSTFSGSDDELLRTLTRYMERFSDLAGSLITCFPVLKWLELDNRGNHLVTAEETPINTPAVAAAYVVQNYIATAADELTLKVGDIVSVIDMPPASESVWWRGKLTILKAQYCEGDGARGANFEPSPASTHFMIRVGFFPSHCVQLFGNRGCYLPLVLRERRPVFHRRDKWATFLRLFLTNRPSRRRLKEAGILKERVFGCDLAEHLESGGLDVPVVLKSCAEVIETYGIVDGIYRLSGVVSNIQRLRNTFDANRVPNLLEESILQDIHCVASLLKMYFRELPNPLLTYQLYSRFVEAVDGNDSSVKILRLHDVVQQLPPPHFRTAEYLIKHLMRVGENGHKTGMHYPNLAIVWAPNLLRCKDLENVKENANALLKNVNVQAVIVEYLIRYADIIFSRKMPSFSTIPSGGVKRRARPLSLACPTSVSPSKLIDLDEAQRIQTESRHQKLPPNIGLPDLSNRKCIDVNGGPAAVPPKYHTVLELPSTPTSKTGKGWRTFFHAKRPSQIVQQQRDGEQEKNAMKRAAVDPLQNAIVLRRAEYCRDENRNEQGGSCRKRLRHVRSAENFTTPTLVTRTACSSLDSSVRQVSNRRSLRVGSPNENVPSTLSNVNWAFPVTPTFTISETSSFSFPPLQAVADNRTQITPLKPCMATDIDHALSVVVSFDASSPTPSQMENTEKTLPASVRASACYLEATVISTPTSPVSEPAFNMFTEWREDKASVDADLVYSEKSSEPATSRSHVDESEEIFENCAIFEQRQSHSAPTSLRRKFNGAILEDSMGFLDLERNMRELPFEKNEISGKENGNPRGNVQILETEEKLLAELSKTPDDSPCRDDLQVLFPELKNIYGEVEASAALSKNGPLLEEEEENPEKASITDLEVIDANPDWRYTEEECKTEKEPPKNIGREIERDENSKPISVLDEITVLDRKISENNLDEDTSAMDSQKVKWSSFKQANILFDRLETLTAVMSAGRSYDSEEEDASFLDSIYDNVSPGKPNLGVASMATVKPTPKPRKSKMRHPGASLIEEEERKVVSILQPKMDENHQEKLKRPTILSVQATVISQSENADVECVVKNSISGQKPLQLQQNVSSSEDSELANSPLFRKQQQLLFFASTNEDIRNKSEPPPTSRMCSGEPGRTEEAQFSPGDAKSEPYLHNSGGGGRGAGTGGNAERRFATSPRSAFSPVMPKSSFPEMHTVQNEDHRDPKLQSILSTRKSPSQTSKTKSARVYFV